MLAAMYNRGNPVLTRLASRLLRRTVKTTTKILLSDRVKPLVASIAVAPVRPVALVALVFAVIRTGG